VGANKETDMRTFHMTESIIDELKRKTKIISEEILILKAIEVLCSVILHKGDRNIYLISDEAIMKYKIEEMYDKVYELNFPSEETKKVKVDFSSINKKNKQLIAYVVSLIPMKNKKKISGDQFVNLAATILLHFIKFIKEEKLELYLSSEDIEHSKKETWLKSLTKLELRETLQFA